MDRSAFFSVPLKILSGVLLLLLLFYLIPASKIIGHVRRVHVTQLALGLALFLLTLPVSSLKLHLILRQAGLESALTDVTKIYFIAHFFNNFIPTSVGGDLVKIQQLSNGCQNPRGTTSAAVALERLTGIIVLVTVGLVTVLIAPGLYGDMGLGFINQGKFWGGLVIAVLLVSFLINQYVNQSNNCKTSTESLGWNDYLDKITGLRRINFTNLVLILILSIGFHLLRAVVFVTLASSLGENLALLQALAMLPVVALISFIPLSVGGIGLKEGVITFCLTGLGFAPETGLTVALSLRLYSVLASLAGGGFYLWGPINNSVPVRD